MVSFLSWILSPNPLLLSDQPWLVTGNAIIYFFILLLLTLLSPPPSPQGPGMDLHKKLNKYLLTNALKSLIFFFDSSSNFCFTCLPPGKSEGQIGVLGMMYTSCRAGLQRWHIVAVGNSWHLSCGEVWDDHVASCAQIMQGILINSSCFHPQAPWFKW